MKNGISDRNIEYHLTHGSKDKSRIAEHSLGSHSFQGDRIPWSNILS